MLQKRIPMEHQYFRHHNEFKVVRPPPAMAAAVVAVKAAVVAA